jgi:hypothetical protein
MFIQDLNIMYINGEGYNNQMVNKKGLVKEFSVF